MRADGGWDGAGDGGGSGPECFTPCSIPALHTVGPLPGMQEAQGSLGCSSWSHKLRRRIRWVCCHVEKTFLHKRYPQEPCLLSSSAAAASSPARGHITRLPSSSYTPFPRSESLARVLLTRKAHAVRWCDRGHRICFESNFTAASSCRRTACSLCQRTCVLLLLLSIMIKTR